MADRVVSIELVANASGLVRGVRAAKDAVGELNDEVQSKARSQREAWATIGTGLTAVGVAMTGVMALVLKTGVAYNSLQQSSRAALTTMLGSAQAANAQMDRLDEFARTSPFAKQTFIQAQQQMLAFGIETKKVIPYLDAVQNAVAAAGGSNAELAGITAIMSKIQSSAKITAVDLMQFGNYGINAADLIGLSMGKTGAQIRTEITAGTIGAEQALDALASGMSKKFDGAAANVKNTFEGSMDRVKAAFRDFAAELAKPLVDPNGGGALVDLLNWTADAFRNFQKLPEPIKLTVSALTGLVGVGSLLLGSYLMLYPKLQEFRAALAAIGVTGGSVRSGLGGLVRFLGGPWGIAFAAAAVAVAGLNKVIEDGRAPQKEIANALQTSADSATALKKAAQTSDFEAFWMGDAYEQLKDLPRLMDDAAKYGTDFWSHVWSGRTNEDVAAIGAIGRMSDALAEVAAIDFSKAQQQFGSLAKSQKLTREQTLSLLETMSPFRDRVLEQASELGIAADSADFLRLAMGEIGPAADKTGSSLKANAEVASETASAYMDQANATKAARDELFKLVDALMESNSIAQKAEGANSRYQQTLADVAEYVANAQAGLDGYSRSIDENTVEGAKNREMLAGMASDSQAAAQAIYQQELKTLGAAQATENYKARIGEGRQALYDTILALTGNADAAQILTDKLYAMPTEREIKILMDTATATSQLDTFLANAPKVLSIQGQIDWANAKMDPFRGPFVANGGTVGYAQGGTITKAAGGVTVSGVGGGVSRGTVYGAGTAKSDSILVALSKGEEVTQEPYASQNRDLLKAINRGEIHQGMLQPPVVVASTSRGETNVKVYGHRGMDVDALADAVYVRLEGRF